MWEKNVREKKRHVPPILLVCFSISGGELLHQIFILNLIIGNVINHTYTQFVFYSTYLNDPIFRYLLAVMKIKDFILEGNP